MNQKISARCATALEIARKVVEELTRSSMALKWLSAVPTSPISLNGTISDKTGERENTYETDFYFPKPDVTVKVRVSLKVWDDTSIRPEILSIKMYFYRVKDNITLMEDTLTNTERTVSFVGGTIESFHVIEGKNKKLEDALVFYSNFS